VRLLTKLIAFLLLVPGPLRVEAAHTQATLLLGAKSARPGDTVMAGVRLRMDQGWHTYWQNPGASGIPTTFEWKLPPGITAGNPQWPIPEKLPDKDLTTYIYTDEVVILVPLKIAPTATPGKTQVAATVSWLECAIQCVPGHAEVEADLQIGSSSEPSGDNETLIAWQQKLPKPAPPGAVRAGWEKATQPDRRSFWIEWNAPEHDQADFFPDANDHFEVQPEVEELSAPPGQVRIRKQLKKLSGDWPKTVSGLLVQGTGAKRSGYLATLDLASTDTSVAGNAKGPNDGTVRATEVVPGLGQMLFYAFIGGFILNFMPCVLPVIALKILGFIGHGKEDPRRGRFLALVYAAGVLVSFLVLAALVLGIKAAGHKAGWGVQFSSPYFLIAMTTLVTLIALNLFGIFEVNLGGRAMDAAAGLSGRQGVAGAFFNGLLATVLATSCTAPFLGAAVGFAFAPSQTPFTTVAVFLMVGVGLALPYVVLTWQPGWLRFLPKPGAWMERFRVAMGFPMLAAAVWLLSLVAVYYGDRSWWLAIFLVMVSVGAWIFGEFIQRHPARRGVAAVAIAGVHLAAYFFVLEDQLRWREPNLKDQPSTATEQNGAGIAWQPWSVAAVEKARSEHRPVLVDFTAKWCLTCNTVIKPALESDAVRQKLKELNAVALLGDYTRFPEDITEELTRHSRAGVPLVLVYPPDPTKPPIVLPEALTASMVVSALDRAQL
jgi:thiol:disulfide interchange protein DsbD